MKLTLPILSLLMTFGAISAYADLNTAGPSLIAVDEAITPLGGGQWQYTYTINSSDPANIWNFLLYTPFTTTNISGTFPDQFIDDLNSVFSQYDARNIDPTLTTMNTENYMPFGGPNGLSNGGTATLTFDASVFNDSRKLYAYEDVTTGYALSNDIGNLAADGYTGAGISNVPEPGLVGLLGGALAAVVLSRRRLTA